MEQLNKEFKLLSMSSHLNWGFSCETFKLSRNADSHLLSPVVSGIITCDIWNFEMLIQKSSKIVSIFQAAQGPVLVWDTRNLKEPISFRC